MQTQIDCDLWFDQKIKSIDFGKFIHRIEKGLKQEQEGIDISALSNEFGVEINTVEKCIQIITLIQQSNLKSPLIIENGKIKVEKCQKNIKIHYSELQMLSDLFQIFLIKKAKGFSKKHYTSKIYNEVKKIAAKFPIFFDIIDNQYYPSGICQVTVKLFGNYLKASQEIEVLKVKGIEFRVVK